MKREPLVTVATVTSIVAALLALLAAFGVPLSAEQQAAISGLVAVVAPLVVALLVRPRVSPVPSEDWQVSEKTVADSMRRQGLVARKIKRRNGLTRQDKTKAP